MFPASQLFGEEFAASLASSWEDYTREQDGFSGKQVFSEVGAHAISGGKHIRPRLAEAGWLCVGGDDTPSAAALGDPGAGGEAEALRALGRGLEYFQASALVHDDIIDASPLRRGAPTAHVRFAAWHRERGLAGESGAFGRAGALLLGNYLQACALDCFARAAQGAAQPLRFQATAARMMRAVNFGQYLDVRLEGCEEPEVSARGAELSALLGLAGTAAEQGAVEVMYAKTATYTGIYPLQLGALVAGATDAQLAVLAEVGLRLGLAFQITDDLLGVFGDERKTGKPVGADLREGKRTLLVALALESAPVREAELVRAVLRAGEQARAEQVAEVISILAGLGVAERCEQICARLYADALARARESFTERGVECLSQLAQQMIRREK